MTFSVETGVNPCIAVSATAWDDRFTPHPDVRYHFIGFARFIIIWSYCAIKA